MFERNVFEARVRILGQFVGERVDDFIVELEFPFRDGESDRGRAEALTERIERVRLVRPVRRAPRFRDHFSVAQNHNPVDAVEFLVELLNRLNERVGRDADRLRSSARERSVFVEILRRNERRGKEQ